MYTQGGRGCIAAACFGVRKVVEHDVVKIVANRCKLVVRRNSRATFSVSAIWRMGLLGYKRLSDSGATKGAGLPTRQMTVASWMFYKFNLAHHTTSVLVRLSILF